MEPTLFAEISLGTMRALSQMISGKLLNDEQIKSITSHVVGRHFAEFLSKPQDEVEAQNRVDAARNHLTEATRIIGEFKNELEKETKQLEEIAATLQRTKDEAEKYAQLARLNKEAYAPLRSELQESLRSELAEQARKGRRLRQVVALIVWLVTLVLGSYLPQIVDWAKVRYLKNKPPVVSAIHEPRKNPEAAAPSEPPANTK
jgi:hypothetical protein